MISWTHFVIYYLIYIVFTGDTGLQRVFERHPKLACCQIVTYKADPSCKWFALVGLYKDYDNEVSARYF